MLFSRWLARTTKRTLCSPTSTVPHAILPSHEGPSPPPSPRRSVKDVLTTPRKGCHETEQQSPCATNLVTRIFGSAPTDTLLLLLLLFESDPVRALFDFPAFLRFRHFLGHPVKFLQYNGLAAHTSHERDDERMLWAFVESRTSLSIERSAAAYAAESHVRLDHADHFELTENLVHAIGRVRPDGSQPYETNLRALIAQVSNGVPRRHRVTALHEKDDVGALGHELFNPRVVSSPEDLRKLVVDLLNDRH